MKNFFFQKQLVGHIFFQNNSDLVFQTCTIFLKMSKFVAGHMIFENYELPLSEHKFCT